ncbi:phage tail tape measure protein, lambda family [Pseudomonas sp. NFACC02]|uniref:phage tail tape measure protein n=1 Tax=Pseudomonas sp. NFACC02 TaxID=1566250 RepID=UPI0008CDC4E4|nr:phage tail tape measure protein [Pseudomonas sp. NFACC02]SEQ28887.1 phage tail tape measure protein, lambda family [Pseudomonas sp. NFACC02]
MSGTIAELGIAVDSGDAVQAATDLDKLTEAGAKAEKAADDVTTGFKKTADAADKLAEAEARAAQATADAKARLIEVARTSLQNSEYYQRLTTSVTSTSGAMDASRDSTASLAALQKRLQAESDALVGTNQQGAKAAKDAAAATGVQAEGLQALLGKISPTLAALQKLDDQQELLNKHRAAGNLGEDDFKAYSADIDTARQKIKGLGDETSKFSLNTKGARENVLQLGNALAEGNFRVAAHNLLEIGTSAGTSALRLAAILAPIAAVAAIVATLGVAWYKGSEEADSYNKALITTGNAAGVSASQLGGLARQVSAVVGTTGAAAEVLATLAANGKLAGDSFGAITQAAVGMQEATGTAVSATIAEFVKLADDPVKASAALNEQYHYLTASVYSQIAALEEQGDHAAAVKLATDQYADAINERTPKILENLGYWERAYNLVAKAADGLKNAGRRDLNTDIQNARDNLLEAQNMDGLFQSQKSKDALIQFRQSQLNFLLLQRDADESRSKYLGDQAKAQQDSIGAMAKIDALTKSSWTNEQKRTEAVKEYKKWLDDIRKTDPNDSRLNQATVDKNIANINDKFKDPKGPANQLNLTGFNDAQNNLKSITGYYQNLQKELDSAQKAGLVSAESYSSQRVAIVEQEKGDVTAAYEAEIAALQAVRDKSSTTGQQRIQLDQKIADARASMVKAQKDADSQLEVLANNEKGRIDKQTRSISQYVQALDQQQKALELAGQRAVLGVGRGDRQNALNAELNSQQDRFAQQSLDLANQKSDPSRNMSDEEFAKKSQALADANKKATDQIRQNYADVQTAQGDWTNGATSAWENYLDSARDIAGQTKTLFTNAFSSMEDAIVNFAMTGKLSFSDFAKSILADMARIATRQASSSLLSSLFGAGLSYFSGGANGFSSGSAAATSSSLGASQTGYSSTYFPQADGGAWLNGVHMFANGGAFTNSVVSSPTAFGMANGKLGVMGEAGDEAVMPLTRTSTGALGVRAIGGGGGSNIQISAPVSIVTQDRSSEGMELDQTALAQNLQIQMKQAAEKAVADSWRPGGVSFRQTRT